MCLHTEQRYKIVLTWLRILLPAKVDEAREILKSLEATIPGLAMVRLRRVSLERRHGNMEEAEALLREAMECGKDTTEMAFYAVKLARHYMKVQKSLSKAKKVLLDAIEKDQVRPPHPPRGGRDYCGYWPLKTMRVNHKCVLSWEFCRSQFCLIKCCLLTASPASWESRKM